MDLTHLILSILGVISAAVTTVLIPFIRSKTTAGQQERLLAWVRIAVSAAEQIYRNGGGRGAEKFAYVREFLRGKGFTFDETAVDAMIEAAVFELNKTAQ